MGIEIKVENGKVVSEHHPPEHSFYDQPLEVQRAFELARIAISVNEDYDHGAELAKKSIELCELVQWHDGLGRSYMFLAQCEQRFANYTNALESYKSAITIFKNNGLHRQYSFAKNNIGNLYALTLDFFSASISFQESIDSVLQYGDYESAIQFQMNLTNMYVEAGNLDLAFAAAKLTLEWMDKYQYRRYRRTLWNNLSKIFFQKKRFEEARMYAEKWKEDLEQFPNKNSLISYHIFLSALSLHQGNFAEGLPHAGEAIRLARDMKVHFYEGQAIQNEASLFYALGQTNRALELYRECCSIFEKIEAWSQLSIATGNLAKILIIQDEAEAFTLFHRSLELARKAEVKHLISEAHLNLYNAYKKTGEIERALYHHEAFHACDRERIHEDTEHQLALVHSKQETELQRRDAEKQKIRAEHLELQLTSQATQLVTQTELLAKFRDELREIVRQSSSQDPTIRAIKEKLKQLPCESVDWVKFEKEFIAVHPEFRAKLTEKYPELTKQEIKMCQLARLGLKTYEMSRLLCLSERTIDGHRNGLRKKMGLKPNENLKDFLQGIR